MKRKTFSIALDGQTVATCHSWNARHKYIVAHLKTLGGVWERATGSGKRDAHGLFARGVETWQAVDGRAAAFRVERVA